jgi:magnesium transporter
MRKNFKILNGSMCDCPEGETPTVVVFTDPSPEEKAELIEQWMVDEHNLRSALDPDEIPRIEYDGDIMAIIVKRPMNLSIESRLEFNVSSLGVFTREGRPIAIVQREDMTPFEIKKTRFTTKNGPVLLVLLNIISHYLGHLRAINMISGELEKNLHQALGNQHLISLFTLEKSLVYYVSAIHGNASVLTKMRATATKHGMTEDEIEKLDELIIENDQCLKQAEIYSNILSGMMDARASIVNNNLNHLIKQLTILSVVFMPLNIIAGMGGMSEFSRYAVDTYKAHWAVAYTGFAIAMVFIALLTYWILKRTGLDGGRAGPKFGAMARRK